MQILTECGYKLVPVKEAILDSSLSTVGLSFDDGYESVFTNAYPILQEFGFAGTVFIPSAFIGKWNTWDANLGWLRFKHLHQEQLEILQQNGWEIGAHGRIHRDLVTSTEQERHKEIMGAKQDLECYGDIDGFAYPFSRSNMEIRKLVEQAGFHYSVGVKKSDHFHFSRVSIYRFHTPKMVVRMAQTGKQSSLFRKASHLTILAKKIWK